MHLSSSTNDAHPVSIHCRRRGQAAARPPPSPGAALPRAALPLFSRENGHASAGWSFRRSSISRTHQMLTS